MTTTEPLQHETAPAAALRSRVAEIKPGELFIGGAFRDFHELTMLTGVTPEMRVAREEIFGPVLSIIPVDTEAEALAIADGLAVSSRRS